MKNLQKQLRILLSKDYSTFLTTKLYIAIIFLVSLIFFYPVLIQNKIALPVDALVGAHIPWTEILWPEYPAGVPIKNLEITDAFSQFYPWRSLVGEFWRDGKVPLWNNYMFSGTPFLAALHSAALYPLNFVYIYFSDINSWNIIVYLQIALALLFMFLFLKEITRDNIASIFGAIAFSFSGYMIAWLEFATGGHAGLWLPLLLFLQYKFYITKNPIFVFSIPFVIFMILTAGDFQVPFYSLSVYIAFGLYLGFVSKEKLKTCVYFITALVVGILLSLPQWLPTLELFSMSIRTNDPYIKEYYYGIFHWEKLVNFIWPDFFGNVVTRNYWGKFGYHEYLSFVGSMSLVLISFWFATKKTKIEYFFFGLLVVALLFLFPTPLAFLPFKLGIPGLGTSSASRILFLVGFCLSTLAAFGLSKLKSDNLTKLLRSVFYLIAASIGVALGLVISVLIFNKSGIDVQIEINLKVALKNMIPTTLILLTFWFATLFFKRFSLLKINNLKLLIVVILLAEMLRFGWKNTPFSKKEFVFPETKITTFLTEHTDRFRIAGGIPLNLFMPFGIKSVEGYDPIYPATNSLWYSYINSRGPDALSGRYGLVHDFSSSLLNLSSMKYLVDYKKNPLNQPSEYGSFSSGNVEPKFNTVLNEGRIGVFENKDALPIAWLTTDYIVENDKSKTLEILSTTDTVAKKQIILEEDPKMKIEDRFSNHTVSKFNLGLNEVFVDVQSDTESLLFLSQTLYPGWKAYIDGIETKIYKADYLYQAIAVPKGESKVHFVYEPKSYRIGKYIALMTLSLMAVGFSIVRKKSA